MSDAPVFKEPAKGPCRRCGKKKWVYGAFGDTPGICAKCFVEAITRRVKADRREAMGPEGE